MANSVVAVAHEQVGRVRTHGLDQQAERQDRGGGQHEARRVERADAAAKADGRDGEDARPKPMPSSAGFDVKASPPVLRGQDTRSTPMVAIAMAAARLQRDAVAEEQEAEDGNLHGLRLGVGGDHHEGAVAHGGKQQRGRADLCQRGGYRPRQRG